MAGIKMNYKEHYRIDALEFDYWGKDQLHPTETRRNQTVFELCPLQAGDNVLDVGSGRGWFSLHTAEQGAHVTALDLSEANLQRLKELNPDITTVLADACEYNPADIAFDWVVALEILEHLVEPKAAIQNWKKLLKPNGKLLITVPYKEVLRYTLCIHCNQKTPVNAHLHSFDRESLIKLLNHHGFWVKETRLFSHKLLSHLRVNSFLKPLPYRWWKALDRACRLWGDKYSYLGIVAVLKK